LWLSVTESEKADGTDQLSQVWAVISLAMNNRRKVNEKKQKASAFILFGFGKDNQIRSG